MTHGSKAKPAEQVNLRYIGMLALAAGLILLVGSLLRPSDQPDEQPVSQTELTRLRRASQRTSMEQMSEYFSDFSGDLARHVLWLEEFDGSGIVWESRGAIVAAVRDDTIPDTVHWITESGTTATAQTTAASPLLPVALLQAPPIVTMPPPVVRAARSPRRLGDWLLIIGRKATGEYVISPGWFGGASTEVCQGRSLRTVETSQPLTLDMLGAGLFDIQGDLIAILVQCDGRAIALAASEVDSVLLQATTTTSMLLWQFGIRVDLMDENEIAYLGSSEGFLIREVWKKSPAEEMGLVPGDVILSLGDRPVNQISELQPLYVNVPAEPPTAAAQPDTEAEEGEQAAEEAPPLELEILRAGRRMRFSVPTATGPTVPVTAEPGAGIVLTRPPSGFRIDSVIAGSPAAQAGLRAGDRVLSISGTEVRRPDQVAQMLDSPDRRPVFVVLDRGPKILGLLIP